MPAITETETLLDLLVGNILIKCKTVVYGGGNLAVIAVDGDLDGLLMWSCSATPYAKVSLLTTKEDTFKSLVWTDAYLNNIAVKDNGDIEFLMNYRKRPEEHSLCAQL